MKKTNSDDNILEKKPINKPMMDRKEIIILFSLIFGFFLMGSAAGGGGAISFTGLGLIIWVIWRGRKL